MNSWPEPKNPIPVQLDELLHIKQDLVPSYEISICMSAGEKASKPLERLLSAMGFRPAGRGQRPVLATTLGLGDVQARELRSQLLLWSKVTPIL